jgi:hypothetical protein
LKRKKEDKNDIICSYCKNSGTHEVKFLKKKQAEENGNDEINSVAGEATDVALTRMTLSDKIGSNNCIDRSGSSCHF